MTDATASAETASIHIYHPTGMHMEAVAYQVKREQPKRHTRQEITLAILQGELEDVRKQQEETAMRIEAILSAIRSELRRA